MMADGSAGHLSLRASDALSDLHDALLTYASAGSRDEVSFEAGTKVSVGRAGSIAAILEDRRSWLAGAERFAVASLDGTAARWHVETEDGAAWAGQVWLTGRGRSLRTNAWLGGSAAPMIARTAKPLPALRFVAQPHHLTKLAELASSDSTVDGLSVIATWEMRPTVLEIAPADFVTWLRDVWGFLAGTDRAVDVTPWDEMALAMRRRDGLIEVRRDPDGLPPFAGTLRESDARRDILHAIGEVRAAVERVDLGLRSTRSLAWLFGSDVERALGKARERGS